MRTLLTLLLATLTVVSLAQKKPKINQAISALEDGELAEAKSIIDAAIIHEKTKDDPKTWFYRGQIYAALDTANNEPGALEESIKAFDKTIELDPEQKEVNSVDFTTGAIVNVDSKKQGYYAYYYNQAINAYNVEDFNQATDHFETAFYINPTDTNAVLNAAYAALAAEDNARAKDNFAKSYDAGVRNKTMFLQLYNLSLKEEDYDQALTHIRQGKEAFPNDTDFSKYEINLLIQTNQIEDAKKELETSIANDPNNPDLYFSLGVLQEESGNVDEALSSYKKAIEIDPDHYNSNFNLGVAMFNKVNELIKERNALSYKETEKDKKLSNQISDQLKAALPRWEKLYSLNSEDRTVLETLSYIYTSLRMNDKAEKMEDELEDLED